MDLLKKQFSISELNSTLSEIQFEESYRELTEDEEELYNLGTGLRFIFDDVRQWRENKQRGVADPGDQSNRADRAFCNNEKSIYPKELPGLILKAKERCRQRRKGAPTHLEKSEEIYALVADYALDERKSF